MKTAKFLLEGIKLIALFGAIALVVMSMPEPHNLQLGDNSGNGDAATIANR